MTNRKNPDPYAPIIEDIRAAATRLEGVAMRTPLMPLKGRDATWLKLENLQPVGSFKVRPIGNVIVDLAAEEKERGVFTASSGNTGIAVAWMAAKSGIKADVVVPENAPAAKLDMLEDLGAHVHKVSFEDWWKVILTHQYPSLDGVFIDPVADDRAIAGDATIGLEIVEQLPDVDNILVPFGGGGLACGVASAVQALKPGVRVIACESEAAAPLAAAFRDGKPVEVDYRDSFITGIGVGTLLPWMWPLVRQLIDGSAVVTLQQTVDAICQLAEQAHIVAEGAGAVPVAAALSGQAGEGKTVCVVSGGNISKADLITCLQGKVPSAIAGTT